MGKIAKVQEVTLEKLIPYVNNAKIHSEEQVTKIAGSIREFGFLSPVLIDAKYNIIAGHGRVMAAKKLQLESVPCVFIEGLSEAQRKAYILADNRLSDLGSWDMEIVAGEFEELRELNFDLSLTGFSFPDLGDQGDWFEDRERNDTSRQEGNDEYNEFLDKFEIAKTTDDCYTPDNIYDAVADWVAKEYQIKREDFVRPFKPGGDYQKENYDGKIVVDNPPFSLLSTIEEWYNEHNVKYFLFAPHVSNFPSKRKCCAICVGVGITYENGAKVSTSFVTNLEDLAARTAPELYRVVFDVNKENTKGKEFPCYEYPPEVVTAAMLCYLSKYGQDFRLEHKDASERIKMLDCQQEIGKGIFGGGFLISEKAAAEKAAAEKAAAEKATTYVWKLSDREKEIIKSLGNP